MICHWFFAISVSHTDCPLFYASSTFHLLVSISQDIPSSIMVGLICQRLFPHQTQVDAFSCLVQIT